VQASPPLLAFWSWRTSFEETTCLRWSWLHGHRKVFPKRFWHFRNIECVQVVHPWDVHKVVQMPWSPFRYNPWFDLHHGELLHSHQQTFKARV
jgi:hypothetical protein